jgi:LEA14-like dessication related protein
MKRYLIAGLMAVALTGTGACSSLARNSFGTPVVQLKDVRVKGIGMNGGSLDLVLDVYNPNAYRLDATKMTYNLYVDTNKVATGEVVQHVQLDDKKTTQVILPVTFTFKEMLGAAKVITGMGSVDYRVIGDVTVATPFGSFTRPYEGKGRYDTLKR